ncbi:MAG: Rpn family recombination-promoting nuclease/putative transposase [Lachnospiraceae bacterium]|nr:Rpn family recombination-promoting nuclease/putative transposase [Lachnospiraceae bacterium]
MFDKDIINPANDKAHDNTELIKNINKGQIPDINNRQIFHNHTLCAQFLRNFTDIDILKDIQPEDIIDESDTYQAYLGIKFETDTVKRIHIKDLDFPLYIISLIEHKSNVDYNVAMQLLKYMALIWDVYGKKHTDGQGNPRNKEFKYPPVIPIVYYEGANKWTADMHLQDRVFMSEIFKDYIPDFKYKLVNIHDYTNDKLLSYNDEMSVLMMLNKIQTAEDLNEFINTNSERIAAIMNNTNEAILETFQRIIWNLYMKLNVSPEEAQENLRNVRTDNMGYWFENMEKMDIQAERRNTAEARRELEEERQALTRERNKVKQLEEEVRQLKEQLAKA